MDDQRVGAGLRAVRLRKGWRQLDVVAPAGVSRWVVSRFERGRFDGLSLATIRRVARALDARADLLIRWQGGDLPRLLNARHAAMHEAVARWFASLPDWIAEPEVSYSIYGERGVIDILAWHPRRRILAGPCVPGCAIRVGRSRPSASCQMGAWHTLGAMGQAVAGSADRRRARPTGCDPDIGAPGHTFGTSRHRNRGLGCAPAADGRKRATARGTGDGPGNGDGPGRPQARRRTSSATISRWIWLVPS